MKTLDQILLKDVFLILPFKLSWKLSAEWNKRLFFSSCLSERAQVSSAGGVDGSIADQNSRCSSRCLSSFFWCSARWTFAVDFLQRMRIITCRNFWVENITIRSHRQRTSCQLRVGTRQEEPLERRPKPNYLHPKNLLDQVTIHQTKNSNSIQAKWVEFTHHLFCIFKEFISVI